MLDVQGRWEDVNPRSNLQHIHDTASVYGFRSISVRQFVDQHEGWFSPEYGVDVHLVDRCTPVVYVLPGNHFKPAHQRKRFLTTMCLDIADDDIDSFVQFFMRGLQSISYVLPTPFTCQKNIFGRPVRLGALFTAHRLQQFVRIGPDFFTGCHAGKILLSPLCKPPGSFLTTR